MGFSVIQNSPQSIWIPVEYEGTIYNGSIACLDVSAIADYSGAFMLPIAVAAWNATGFDIPFGVVIGNNNRRPVFNSTAMAEYITDASPLASTTEFVSTGSSEYPMGGREAMVKVDVIDPCTVLRGNLWLDAPGAAPTVVTTTAANSVSCTTGACDVATVEGWATIYFRTGPAAGTYRQLNSTTSTTAHTWNKPTQTAVAIGDTAVIVNIRAWGISHANLVATYLTGFDIDHECSTDYFGIDVVRLNLAEANKEVVDFRWNIINFYPATNRD